jgi:hypothetical protein
MQNHLCGYATVADVATGTKKCLELYSQEEGTEFGADLSISDSIDKIFKNGRYCKSGIAYIKSSTATCSTLTKVTSNIDSYKVSQE